MPPPGIGPRTFQPVASRYTDCALLAHLYKIQMNVLVIRQPPYHANISRYSNVIVIYCCQKDERTQPGDLLTKLQ